MVVLKRTVMLTVHDYTYEKDKHNNKKKTQWAKK